MLPTFIGTFDKLGKKRVVTATSFHGQNNPGTFGFLKIFNVDNPFTGNKNSLSRANRKKLVGILILRTFFTSKINISYPK